MECRVHLTDSALRADTVLYLPDSLPYDGVAIGNAVVSVVMPLTNASLVGVTLRIRLVPEPAGAGGLASITSRAAVLYHNPASYDPWWLWVLPADRYTIAPGAGGELLYRDDLDDDVRDMLDDIGSLCVHPVTGQPLGQVAAIGLTEGAW